MTCEEHDRQAASTQFVTHTVGRMLGAMELTSTEINTKGFEALLQLVENTNHDSFDLYYGLFLYNTNATGALSLWAAAIACAGLRASAAITHCCASFPRPPGPLPPRSSLCGYGAQAPGVLCCALCWPADELERLEKAFDVVKKQLFGRLHAIARKSLLPDAAVSAAAAAPASNGGRASSRSSSSNEDDSSSKSSGSITSTNSSVASLSGLADAPPASLANGKVHKGTAKSVPSAAAKASENGVAAAAEPSK